MNLIQLMALVFIVFCTAVYATDPIKSVPALVVTIIGVLVGIYYAFFRKLEWLW